MSRPPATKTAAAPAPLLLRVSGGGNDFLALVEPTTPPASERIRAWCRRGLSLGADGLFVLTRGATGGERPVARMDYWNADGEPADLCLNGTRCAARLAFHLGWATAEVEVQTGAGPVRARPAGKSAIALELPPLVAAPREVTLEHAGRAWHGWLAAVGVPHLVLPWEESLERAPVAEVGPVLRRHPGLGPAGANVDFVRFRDRDRLDLRTYERGVEAETLACGTGALAAAAVGRLAGRCRLPVACRTLGGFALAVGAGFTPPAAEQGGADRSLPERWSLAGDARLVARIEPLPEADVVPAPPAW